MYVYYLHFHFYLISTLSQGITRLQNSYLLSLHPVYLLFSEVKTTMRNKGIKADTHVVGSIDVFV